MRSLLLTFLVACGVYTIPAPMAPQPTLPAVSLAGEIPAERGRVVVDSDRPSEVIMVDERGLAASGGGYAASGTVAMTRTLCVTPCAADVPLGPTQLVLRSDEEHAGRAFVNVTQGVSVVRVNLGRHETHHARRFGGVVGMVVGGIMTLSGVGMAFRTDENAPGKGPSIGLAVAGSALVAGGVYLWMTGETIEQDSSSTIFVPESHASR